MLLLEAAAMLPRVGFHNRGMAVMLIDDARRAKQHIQCPKCNPSKQNRDFYCKNDAKSANGMLICICHGLPRVGADPSKITIVCK